MLENNMATLILETAQHLMQTRGYHGFSYADISDSIGIRKASIHYYYPSKTDLGVALVSRYREVIRGAVCRVEAMSDGPLQQLQGYAEIYRDMLRCRTAPGEGLMCVAGSLAAELTGLPLPVREQAEAFFRENEEWLACVFAAGRTSGHISFQCNPLIQAQAFLAQLEGAMLLARIHNDVNRYCDIVHHMMGRLRSDTCVPVG